MVSPTPSDFDDRELVIRYVISYMVCDMCGSAYRLENVQLIEEGDNAWAMVVYCTHCKTESLVLAIASPLDEAEMPGEAFLNGPGNSALMPLTMGDVRDWAAFLAGFHGDMKDLLQATGY